VLSVYLQNILRFPTSFSELHARKAFGRSRLEIRIKRFEGGDERQTPIIFALLNLDSHTCRKSAFSLVSPDNAKQAFRQLHWRQDPETTRPSGSSSDAVIMAKDHCWIRLNIVQITNLVVRISHIVSLRRAIVCQRCDGLIILQAENLATSE
jgi:hypothetical protein